MTKAIRTENILIREMTLSNILSYAPQTKPIPLGNLNVLIGPNGSGKSNLIEIISLLRAAPGELGSVTRRGGGVGEWIWKGNPNATAGIEIVANLSSDHQHIRHVLEFTAKNQRFFLEDERVENENPFQKPDFYYRYQKGNPFIAVDSKGMLQLPDSIESDVSILSQRRDPDFYPVISALAGAYEKIRIYREWTFGRNAVFREPQKADMRNDRLEEDFSNLGLFLNKLRRIPAAKRAILSALEDLYEGLSDFDVSIEGGTVQVFFTEGDFTIPATRLSDGTLRYLCLLAILCDPNPPPLVCIEEPELGLHPDILPKLADLLVAASARTQLIVTTHSDILVDAMTERPETILVCEKHEGRTTIERLEGARLAVWLESYKSGGARLGESWIRGELGGTRW
ncbi:MAG TPA: AAA family ATPase [Blastocatellia bacterium]|nr:AAA family ATPase [Blastocatellia bacterium]HMV83740.1 AAA family ATPase [Blastocatellia bacterium]HMX26716.1 AAA family ATPase [Blastocatellia bacterium]HMY73220.1 AAA family ATPase [Blastocatellia bacterium]HMZ20450.1 AAA family ATPase [Blastocatellia bacterium]